MLTLKQFTYLQNDEKIKLTEPINISKGKIYFVFSIWSYLSESSFKYILVLQWTNKIGGIKILSDGIEGM